jgi:SAM-dependent methyltransferase
VRGHMMPPLPSAMSRACAGSPGRPFSPQLVPTEDRTRSLESIEELLEAAGGVEAAIRKLLDVRSPVDVLEVGFGHGRALLELAWRLRDSDVRFHGVDAGYKSPIQRPEDLRGVARTYGIVPEEELERLELPSIAFYDATELRFPDESLDLVFSAVTIRFMPDKARHIEEACRVLRPGGRAILHIGEANWNYPWGKTTDDRVLTPYTSRFVLKHGDDLVPLPDYLELFEGDVFRFGLTLSTRCILIVDKLAPGRLALELDRDDDLTMNGRKVPLRNRHGDVRGGIRSVYNVRTPVFERLVSGSRS